jgi:chemotaxis protein CheZ
LTSVIGSIVSNANVAARADRSEIVEVVSDIVSSLRGDLSAAELSMYQEIEALGRFIRDAKSEIASLRPDEIREKYLPTATDELDAIVEATAEATHVILEAVEGIEKIAAQIDPAQGKTLGENVTRIYEACTFQDITGQRITKVVRTLKAMEEKIDGVLSAFGDEIKSERAAPAAEPPIADPTGEAHLLNGPQLPDAAASQADIDALFDKA